MLTRKRNANVTGNCWSDYFDTQDVNMIYTAIHTFEI